MKNLNFDWLLNKYKTIKLRVVPSSLILIAFLLFILIVSFSKNTLSVSKINKKISKENKISKTLNTPTTTSIPTPSLTLAPSSTVTPTQAPTKIPLPTSFDVQAVQSSGNQDLLSAVNAFRSKNGLGALSSNSTLCSIAQSRVSENATLGQLDNHAGFEKYFKGQAEFKGMGENLHWATYTETPTEIVENGWANSPGHKTNMLDSKWQYGCGGQAGSYYASFIFATK